MPEGQLVNRSWLQARGFNRFRVDYAMRAGKLDAVTRGVYRRPGPPLKWEHVVYSLNEMGYKVRVGGRSALELQGLAHYLPLGGVPRIDLYSPTRLPGWLHRISDAFKFEVHSKRLFRDIPKTALLIKPFGGWDWLIPYSTPELALVELVADVREAADFSIADKFFESAVGLRPRVVRDVLEACDLVKAKRLFLWFSDRHDNSWRRALDIEGIDLGRGKRMLVKGGTYDATYQITVPKEMAAIDEHALY